jgi:hypothetical protein
MSNFSDLKVRIQEWNNDDEDTLLRKIRQFTENYTQNTSELASNLKMLENQVKKIEINYHHSLNTLKNISIKKFVEHSISGESVDLSSRKKQNKAMKVNSNILTKEEREASLITKFQSAISISLDNLNIKNLIDVPDNKDVIDDDDKSVSSSKYFSNMNNKTNKSGLKLPYIIGQEGFFKSPTLGISDENIQNVHIAPQQNEKAANSNQPQGRERGETTISRVPTLHEDTRKNFDPQMNDKEIIILVPLGYQEEYQFTRLQIKKQ